MTASLTLEGRVYLTCDGCGQQHSIHAYGITKTRAHAANRGWVRTGEPGDRRDWCPECEPVAESEPEADEANTPSLFDLLDLEAS